MELADQISTDYDSVIVAVAHQKYKEIDENYLKTILLPEGLVVDLKNILKGKITNFAHWTL